MSLIILSDNGSGVDSNAKGLSVVSVDEKGKRNKRKFLFDLSLNVPVNGLTLSLTEFPIYEMLEENSLDVS